MDPTLTSGAQNALMLQALKQGQQNNMTQQAGQNMATGSPGLMNPTNPAMMSGGLGSSPPQQPAMGTNPQMSGQGAVMPGMTGAVNPVTQALFSPVPGM